MPQSIWDQSGERMTVLVSNMCLSYPIKVGFLHDSWKCSLYPLSSNHHRNQFCQLLYEMCPGKLDIHTRGFLEKSRVGETWTQFLYSQWGNKFQ